MSGFRILEYLGGIETYKMQYTRLHLLLILEYLGGIETLRIAENKITAKMDFRIPRRD